MSTATTKDDVSAAIRECFGTSTYVDGSENLTTAIDRVASVFELDETLDKIGGEIQGRLGEIAAAINNLAEAIRERPAP